VPPRKAFFALFNFITHDRTCVTFYPSSPFEGRSDQCLTTYKEKNPERVAAGLKATVHNAKTSEDMKQNAARRLDDMGVEIEQPGSTHKAGTGASATGEFGKGAYTSVDYTNDPKEADIGACTTKK